MLDRLDRGVFLVGRDLTVTFANREGERLLRSGSGLTTARGRLVTASPAAIADGTAVSLAPVRTHLSHIVQKTGARRRAEFVALVRRTRGILDEEAGIRGSPDGSRLRGFVAGFDAGESVMGGSMRSPIRGR